MTPKDKKLAYKIYLYLGALFITSLVVSNLIFQKFCKMFGDEEERLISPAIDLALAEGWQASGPFPPDTVFNKAAAGEFDAVVCMYHDQGLIPFKLLHFADGVNVTLGLPIIRTSVDHGTAYDIAGQGKANAASLVAAYVLAGEIADNRNRFAENRKMY